LQVYGWDFSTGTAGSLLAVMDAILCGEFEEDVGYSMLWQEGFGDNGDLKSIRFSNGPRFYEEVDAR
jgi:hypothetical protein